MSNQETIYPNYNKKALTQEELESVLELHTRWQERKPGGYRADFSLQDLTLCDLSGMNFTGACFFKTNLKSVHATEATFTTCNFTGANLEAVDLCRSDISESLFTGANLLRTNLFGTKMSGTMGNGKEIKSICIGKFPCTYTSNVIQFACQRHTIEKWVDITTSDLEKMDESAKVFYINHYADLKNLIVYSAPAASTKYLDTRLPPTT